VNLPELPQILGAATGFRATFVILSSAPLPRIGLSASSNAPAMGGKQAASRDTDARSGSAAAVSAGAGRLAARDETQQLTADVDGLPHP
jgi:hypothetical protein